MGFGEWTRSVHLNVLRQDLRLDMGVLIETMEVLLWCD